MVNKVYCRTKHITAQGHQNRQLLQGARDPVDKFQAPQITKPLAFPQFIQRAKGHSFQSKASASSIKLAKNPVSKEQFLT